MSLEEGQIVLCTVEKIVGTTVFVKIEGDGEATLVTSEIAPGRIRNLRDYVVPNKKIVCKVLKTDKVGNIHLSLRRVSAKERNFVLDSYKKEKNLSSMLKTIVKDAERVIEKIKKNETLSEFFEKVKETPKILENLFSKQEVEKILKILNEKKEKEVSVKKNFFLKCEEGDGILKLKSCLPSEARYLAAGRFTLEIKDKNYKDANQKINDLIKETEEKAKKHGCVFALSEKK